MLTADRVECGSILLIREVVWPAHLTPLFVSAQNASRKLLPTYQTTTLHKGGLILTNLANLKLRRS